MAFKIYFKAGKPIKPANINSHDVAAWGFANEWATTSPINQWPRQYVVHYIYEHINRPWLSDQHYLADLMVWIERHKTA